MARVRTLICRRYKTFNMIRFFFLAIVICLASTSIMAQNLVTAFKGVTIIPMTGENAVLENQTLVVRNGLIETIGNMDEVRIPPGAIIIESEGNYLIPGLSEMHAHIPPIRNGEELIEETLFLYLSRGVTTIRGMLGESYHLELREKVKQGHVLGPRIFTSGPSLNGNSVQSIEAAQRMVTDQQKAGYDFLKLHPGLQLEVFDEIVKTAKEVGIPYAGHVSIDVGIRHALESAYASIDHVDGYVEGLVPTEASVNPGDNGFFGIDFTDLVDMALMDELSELTKENNVWVVPTQSLMERWVGPEDPQVLATDPEMKYMSQGTVDRWITTKKSYTSTASYSKELATRFIKLREEIIKDLHENEVKILLGSDAPQVFNIPGFSIMNELESMTRCGLTPYDALEAGTANPAEFFGLAGQFGTLVPGAAADMILLGADPLKDISNVRDQKGVMVAGKWLSKGVIDENLSKIAAKYPRK